MTLIGGKAVIREYIEEKIVEYNNGQKPIKIKIKYNICELEGGTKVAYKIFGSEIILPDEGK